MVFFIMDITSKHIAEQEVMMCHETALMCLY